MKKKMLLFLMMSLMCLCLTGCDNPHDTVTIYNKDATGFDNITIPTKDGYFYDDYEKFTVDEDTIGITIYFSKDLDDTWDTWDTTKE